MLQNALLKKFASMMLIGLFAFPSLAFPAHYFPAPDNQEKNVNIGGSVSWPEFEFRIPSVALIDVSLRQRGSGFTAHYALGNYTWNFQSDSTASLRTLGTYQKTDLALDWSNWVWQLARVHKNLHSTIKQKITWEDIYNDVLAISQINTDSLTPTMFRSYARNGGVHSLHFWDLISNPSFSPITVKVQYDTDKDIFPSSNEVAADLGEIFEGDPVTIEGSLGRLQLPRGYTDKSDYFSFDAAFDGKLFFHIQNTVSTRFLLKRIRSGIEESIFDLIAPDSGQPNAYGEVLQRSIAVLDGDIFFLDATTIGAGPGEGLNRHYFIKIVPSQSLSVTSEGVQNVPISSLTGPPFADTTSYTVIGIPSMSVVKLEAPAVSGDSTFLKWKGCGADEGRNCDILMDRNHIATAAYIRPPSAPKASDGVYNDRVTIEWIDVAEATYHQLFRCTSTATSSCSMITDVARSPYADVTAQPGSVYYYRVKACSSEGCTAFSPYDTGRRNACPNAEINANHTTVNVGERVAITGGGSDPDGDSITYGWSLEKPTGSAQSLVGSGSSVSLTPDVGGVYTVKMTASDKLCSSTQKTLVINVNNSQTFFDDEVWGRTNVSITEGQCGKVFQLGRHTLAENTYWDDPKLWATTFALPEGGRHSLFLMMGLNNEPGVDSSAADLCKRFGIVGDRHFYADFLMDMQDGDIMNSKKVIHGQRWHRLIKPGDTVYFAVGVPDIFAVEIEQVYLQTNYYIQPPIPAACGPSANLLTATAPVTSRCATGSTATTVTSHSDRFTWSCISDTDGPAAQCLAPRGYNVTPTASPNGVLIPSEPQLVEYKKKIEFEVSPASWHRASIIGCGIDQDDIRKSETLSTSEIQSSCTVRVTFTAIPPAGCGEAAGTLVASPPRDALCASGSTYTQVQSTASSYEWTCNSDLGGPPASCNARRAYMITPEVGQNGRMDPASTVIAEYGTRNDFVVQPDEGFKAAASGCGGSWDEKSSLGLRFSTAPITEDCRIYVDFSKLKYSVRATGSSNGSIIPETALVTHGENTTFSVTPNDGSIAVVSGCDGFLAQNIYTTGPITENCSVTATFISGLVNGRPLEGLAGASDSERHYFIDVPFGQFELEIQTGGGIGNVDLYVARGSQPTATNHLCRSAGDSNTESCRISGPSAGRYFVMVRGSNAYSGVELLATYSSASTCPHDDHITLEYMGFSSTITHTACRTITAGPNFTVMTPANVALRAGERITLRPGFRVRAGGRFRAEIDSELASGTKSPAVAHDPPPPDSMPSPLPASTDVVPRTSAELLTWSLLPDGLRSRLSELEATVRDAQQSADGNTIVFATEAALVAEDDNTHSDVYRYAIETDILSLLSADARGHAGNRSSHTPRLDGTGRHVLYLSSADDLVAGPSNRYTQLYHADLLLATTTRLTETLTGRPGRGDTTQPLLAGEWAIYRTEAPDLAPEGPGIYRQHLDETRRQAVGLDPWGLPDPRARHPAADAAGAQIAYQRPDADDREQIHLNDGLTVERLVSDEDPVFGWLEHGYAALSPDGRYLAYRAQGSAGRVRLHLLDREHAETVILQWPEDPTLQDLPPRFSADGAELWWIASEQGPDLPEILFRVGNPLAAPEAVRRSH